MLPNDDVVLGCRPRQQQHEEGQGSDAGQVGGNDPPVLAPRPGQGDQRYGNADERRDEPGPVGEQVRQEKLFFSRILLPELLITILKFI